MCIPAHFFLLQYKVSRTKNITFISTMSSTGQLLFQLSSVTQSCPTLQSHGLQHTRLPSPSLFIGQQIASYYYQVKNGQTFTPNP